MVVPSAGAVVLVPFPFSDLSQTKLRPAVCLTNVGRGDWILAQITSKPYGDPIAIPISSSDFQTGGLANPSVVRPGKLFTANAGLMLHVVGVLYRSIFEKIRDSLSAMIQSS